MNEQETIADIIAEKRRVAEQMRNNLSTVPVRQWDQEAEIKSLEEEADRIEAAWTREKSVIEADALAVGGIVGAAHGRELSKNASKNGADFGQLGDSAKMREALGKILWCLEWMFNNTDDKSVQSHLGEPIALAKSALAAPPRNCDVGTAEDQAKRLNEWCNGRHCTFCRFKGGWPDECKLNWAQMPYKEGGAK